MATCLRVFIGQAGQLSYKGVELVYISSTLDSDNGRQVSCLLRCVREAGRGGIEETMRSVSAARGSGWDQG